MPCIYYLCIIFCYRWEVVAQFINQHTKSPEIVRAAKETLGKAKQMQQGDFHLSTLKDEVNKKAYENLEKQKKPPKKVDEAEASTRTETAAEVQGLNLGKHTSICINKKKFKFVNSN